jgi:hypothetical protein
VSVTLISQVNLVDVLSATLVGNFAGGHADSIAPHGGRLLGAGGDQA